MTLANRQCPGRIGFAVFAIALLGSDFAATAQDVPHAILVTGAKVLDPAGEKWLDGCSVLIERTHITAVAPAAEVRPPSGAKTIDLPGLYLVPGLMDLHTHLLLHPYDETLWDDQVLRESLELRTIRGVVQARATVESGFTTIRDLGTEGAGFADVALRDAISRGMIPGPRICASTKAIVATGCYGPAGLDPRWDAPQGADEATGADELRRVVRRQIHAGADWIKFYADYHRAKGAPATPTFSLDEMKTIVDEARSAGRPVAAHATTDEGIRRAVLAGVQTIEHGYGATGDTLKLMRDHHVTLCPTLAASEAYARYFSNWKPGRPEPADMRHAKETFASALKAGVNIACGSDAGVFAHGESARELELMVEGGMTPVQALRAATTTAATVIGRGDDLGRIATKYAADLIALRSDPLREISATRKPVLVIKDGRVVVDRR